MAGLKTSSQVAGLFFVLVGILCIRAAAQSGCTTALIKLSPCLNFITGNSSIPSSSCCAQLASVVQSQPRCLCTALGGGGTILGITINQTRALELPGTCNVKTPPVSQCNSAADGPAMSPTESPVSSPSASPSDSTGGDNPADQIPPIIPSDPSSGPGSAVDGPSANASPSYNSFQLTIIQTLILAMSVVVVSFA